MVTLQKSEKRKDHSNRVKITLKTSENHSKASEKLLLLWREWESLQKSDFHFLGELTEGQLLSSPKKWNSLFWSDSHSLRSDFHSLWNDFHSFWEWFSLG